MQPALVPDGKKAHPGVTIRHYYVPSERLGILDGAFNMFVRMSGSRHVVKPTLSVDTCQAWRLWRCVHGPLLTGSAKSGEGQFAKGAFFGLYGAAQTGDYDEKGMS